MTKLTTLPNIGTELAKKLEATGIKNAEELKATGSKNAIIRIDTLEAGGACINMLYALEGAIQGIRWHNLDEERKNTLKMFYNSIKKG